MEDRNEIDIMRLIGVLLRRWYMIIGAGVLVGVLAFLYTSFLVTPLYRATATVYVSNKVDFNTNQDEVDYSSLVTSQSLVPIYSTMVSTNLVLEKVADDLRSFSDEELGIKKNEINYTATQLQGMISTDQYEDTAVLLLNVTNPNKKYCAVIANSIATTGVTEIANVNDGSTGYVIDKAEVPPKPYYPSVGRNVLIGFLIGFLFMAIVLIVRDIFDTKVRTEEMLSSIIGAPVLGRIGTFTLGKSVLK